jgi:hypothetical protein
VLIKADKKPTEKTTLAEATKKKNARGEEAESREEVSQGREHNSGAPHIRTKTKIFP